MACSAMPRDVSTARAAAARISPALHLIGAVAAFTAIGTYVASQSPLGQLLPAGESPGFVWLRERSALLVWIALAWLFALALLRQIAIPGTAFRGASRAQVLQPTCLPRRRRVDAALAAVEIAALLAVAWAIVRSWRGLLPVAHSLLQAAILLQFIAAARAEPPHAVSFVAIRERCHG